MAPSKKIPTSFKKGGTVSARNFSYQSFTQKIANLKIDPIRKVRRHVDDEESQKSFFRPALDTWVERNLSSNFTQFAKEVEPLTDSLPHIIHYQDEIMDLLVKYIDLKDVHSLEPLMDLLSQFARDLGELFEKYFERSITVLSSIVIKEADVSSFEWTFNCLAYLLKYLSRLLVPDLRPLFDILAPLLGKENQKPFVIRFAAEALSFLLRKSKDEPLRLFIQYAFDDLDAHSNRRQYEQGLSTMFLESCVSVDNTIHSKAPGLIRALCDKTFERNTASGPVVGVLEGVLVALIHHTQSPTFVEVQDVVYDVVEASAKKSSTELELSGKLLYTIFTTRKGNRISDWNRGAELIIELLHAVQESGDQTPLWPILKASAVLLQSADMSVVISRGTKIIEGILKNKNNDLFLGFCELLVQLDSDKFQRFMLRYFHRFVCDHWKSMEPQLLLLIPDFSAKGYLRRVPDIPGTEDLPGNGEWIASIENSIAQLSKSLTSGSKTISPANLATIWHQLSVLPALIPANKPLPKFTTTFKKLFSALLDYSLVEGFQRPYIALYGKCLSISSSIGIDLEDLPWNFLRNAFPVGGDILPFLQGTHEYISKSKSTAMQKGEELQIIEALIKNLRSSSTEIRNVSLQCLEILHEIQYCAKSEVIDVAVTIESTEPTLDSARSLSMYARRFAALYPSIPKDNWVSKLTPSYLFGLLTMQFSPIWEDALYALTKVAESDAESVISVAFEWLQQDNTTKSQGDKEEYTAPTSLTPFQCSNLRNVDKYAEGCTVALFGIETRGISSFEKVVEIKHVPLHMAHAQSLKVLCELPQLAQRKSKELVPLLLEWVRIDTIDGEDDENDKLDEGSHRSWSRKDRFSMLTLFSKFCNPRFEIYQPENVYAAFLHLLKSGDSRIQSLALKCVLTWNNPSVKAYAINLDNLLDDTRFKDELTNFVQLDESESLIQAGHREGLMPVLLRILYGRSLSRKNASSGTKGMESTRTIILSTLAHFTESERGMFIDIALGDLASLDMVNKSNSDKFTINPKFDEIKFSTRRQVGLIKMVQDMMKQLGSKMLPFVSNIFDALLYCLISYPQSIKDAEDAQEGEVVENQSTAKSSKTVRQAGFKALNSLFTTCPNFSWGPYLPLLFDNIIKPRLELLPIETAQAPSGILQLFATWASSRHTVLFLANYDSTILQTIAQCIITPSAKDEVVKFILKMFQTIVELAKPGDVDEMDISDEVQNVLIRPNLDFILARISEILHKSPGKDVLELGIETVSQLAPYVSEGMETTRLVNLSVFLLDQPTKRVSPRTKSDILKILSHFLPLCVMEKGDELFENTFRSISSLFGYFKDRPSRQTLGVVFSVFSQRDETLVEVASLCQQLNSYSQKRIDEPDFEQRLIAFAAINEEKYRDFTVRQWTPLIYNMLYFIKDNEELAIRTNASYALRRFAEIYDQMCASSEKEAYMTTLESVLLPAVRYGTREKSELVRMEYVSVMSHLVRRCSTWAEICDMQPLLVGDDEEANFFNNILHIQQHRRARALRRLAASATTDGIQSSNVAHFFLPLIEHFVFDQEGAESHNLAAETVTTIGSLVEQLTWVQFKATFKRYVGYIKVKEGLEKTVIRLIGVAVDALSRAWIVSPHNPSNVIESKVQAVDEDGDAKMESAESTESVESAERTALSKVLPTEESLTKEICNGFLPTLVDYLHEKDESTVGLRVTIAISLVKLLKLLPRQLLQRKLPGVLTDVCHILRSRAQESRDLTRKTLTDITTLLGQEYFSFILKELRGALLRGYQLHVLSFTMHSILISVVPTYSPGALDYCLPLMMDIIMDDIFGVTGMEKDAEGYVSKMREVKSSKSYDSAELLAQTATLPNLAKMIRPIQALLEQNLTLKLVKKIDELLRRIGLGLMKNEAVNSRQILIFCYQSIQETYISANAVKAVKVVDEQTKRYLVNLKTPGKGKSTTTTNSHGYKLIRFALDIVRFVLSKYDNLMTPENLAGFIPIIGDAVLSKHEEVQIAALRLLTTVIRVQLPSIDRGAPVFVKQSISFIKSCQSTNSELAQASLKLMTALLRDRQNATVKETGIAYILTRVKPDLEEPDRQGITFNFLRAVLNRKVVIPEVYDVLDNIAQIMVTNQTRAVRDMARGTYMQFLMEYPQGKERLKKQYAFLMKNLDYVHQSGRSSILETINLLLMKIGDNLIQDVLSTFFVPVVMVLVNDDSPECREMAGALIKKMMERADNERITTFMNLARQWLSQDDQKLLLRLGLQLYGLYFEVFEARGQKEVAFASERLYHFLKNAQYDRDDDEEPTDWELVYFSLQLWAKFSQFFPDAVFSQGQILMWESIQSCLSYPHAWIRLSSARLMGLFFAEFATAPLETLPLENKRGMKFDGETMIEIARRCSAQLNSLELTEELALQVIKNLLFLGRCFHASGLLLSEKVSTVEEVSDDEEADADEGPKEQKSALLWLIGRISGVIRNEVNMKKIVLGKTSAIKWLAAIVQVIPGEDLIPLAPAMVMPLYNLVDAPENDLIKDLRALAAEVLEMIRQRVGTTAYGQIYSKVREAVQERRRVRKHKRTIQTVMDPETAAQKKMRKHIRKKVVRKEKAHEHRDRRQAN
ncbi:armadillo-type protein [Peziza echinospora]|nr:armadillo-type protein [Peziza echinospora]